MIYFFNTLDGSQSQVKWLDYGCLNRADWTIPVAGPHPMILLKVAGNLAEKDPGSAYNRDVTERFKRAELEMPGLTPCEEIHRSHGDKTERRRYKDRLMLDQAEGVSFFWHQKKDAYLAQYLAENASVATVRELMLESTVPVISFAYSPKTDETYIYIFSKPDEIAEELFRRNFRLNGGIWHWRKVEEVNGERADFSLGLSSVLMLLARLECAVTVLDLSTKEAIVPHKSIARVEDSAAIFGAGADDGLDVATDNPARPFISTTELFSGAPCLAWSEWRKLSLTDPLAAREEPAFGPR